MRILYGVQGTGHGHLVRSANVVRQLRELGHDVRCLLSGRDPSQIPGVEQFEPYTSLRGFTGTARGGRLRVVESVVRLRIPTFFRNVAAFDASGIDLVVTDYEPASGWIARRHRLPSLGVGHLYAFQKRLPISALTRPAQLLVGGFARVYTPVERALGLHWHHFGGPNLPPTVPDEVYSGDTVHEDKVLVYLPGESEADMSRLFARFPHVRFVAYRPIPEERVLGNLTLRPHDRARFLADLADAGGVITNGGFSLPSEALHLGRRLLVKPIRRHPEQYLNGRALAALGLGTVTHRLSPEVLGTWLESERPPAMRYPDITTELVRFIDAGSWDRIDELVAESWSRVDWSPPARPSL